MPGVWISRAAALLLYVFAVSLPLALALIYGTETGANAIETFAALCLQVAFPILALQPVIASRPRILDRLFGLDNVYLFHKTMGMTAGASLLAAFILFASELETHSVTSWLKIPSVSSLLAAALIAGALLHRQIGLSYEKWRLTHNVAAIAVIALLFFQGFFTARSGVTVKSLWLLFFLAGVSFYVNHKFLGPMHRRNNPFSVEDIRQETHNVWTLRIRPPENERRFGFLPGQFQFLTFMSAGLPAEEHPFTIASSPGEDGWHASTIKESGDFTSRIGQIKPGDPIAVQAPFGRFSYTLYPDERDLVFITGGIGITPFMSMLRHMRESGADIKVVLLCSNRTEEDIVFKKELEEISGGSYPHLKVVHVLSRGSESWTGERGHIDADVVKRHIEGSVGDKTFYVCGPPPMMSSLIASIIGLGVPSSKVRSERFAL